MSHSPPTTSHGPPQRSRIASALILLLHHLDPTLDVAHFARHTPLKAGLRSSRDAAAFLAACSAEFGIALQAPEIRDEALWALTGSAAAMYGHHVEGTGSGRWLFLLFGWDGVVLPVWCGAVLSCLC